MAAAVETFHLGKSYNGRQAVRDLSFSVAQGEVLGLMGRNGAGKSVTIRILAGLVRPSEGSFALFSRLRPYEDGSVRSRVSYLSQTIQFPFDCTVAQVLDIAASESPRWDKSLAESLRGRFELPPSANARELSLGEKLRLGIVCAFSRRPSLLFLDEPSGNLDPLARRDLLTCLAEALERDRPAVLFATHLAADLERIADRVAVLVRGSIALEESLESLSRRYCRVQVVFPGDCPGDFSVPGALTERRSGRVFEAVIRDVSREGMERVCASFGAECDIYPAGLEEVFCAVCSAAPGDA